MGLCGICRKKFLPGAMTVSCDGKCNKWVHKECSGLSDAEFNHIDQNPSSTSFKCSNCHNIDSKNYADKPRKNEVLKSPRKNHKRIDGSSANSSVQRPQSTKITNGGKTNCPMLPQPLNATSLSVKDIPDEYNNSSPSQATTSANALTNKIIDSFVSNHTFTAAANSIEDKIGSNIENQLTSMFERVKLEIMASISAELNDFRTKILMEVQNQIVPLLTEIKELNCKFDDLSRKVERNTNTTAHCDERLNQLEDNSRKNNIVVTGLPKLKLDKARDIFIGIAALQGISVDSVNDITGCHYINDKTLLVRLNNTSKKNQILTKYRETYSLKLNDVYPCDDLQSRIYLNSHISAKQLNLRIMGKKLVKTGYVNNVRHERYGIVITMPNKTSRKVTEPKHLIDMFPPIAFSNVRSNAKTNEDTTSQQ